MSDTTNRRPAPVLHFFDGAPPDPVRALREAIEGARKAREQHGYPREASYYGTAYRVCRARIEEHGHANPFAVGYVHAWDQMEANA
jgi:hypothetical protein